MNVNLHIERVVFDGIRVPAGDRKVIQDAIETELTRLLAQQGMPAGWSDGGYSARLADEARPVAVEQDAAEFGRQIANRVYGGLNR